VTRRPKYACRACQEAIVQAPAPARLIEGGLPTERMVDHVLVVLVAKYADHSPLYRQAQILARQGIEIDRTRGVRELLKALAQERRRFGYRRLHVLLRREGHPVNSKRVQQLYREKRPTVRRRGGRSGRWEHGDRW
jgi:transposase